VPVYVHAKVSVVDDEWACVGSDNVNLRSWTHDSELSAAVVDDPDGGFAQRLRLHLAHEHLDGSVPDTQLRDPVPWYDALTASASALDAWHRTGRTGPRPPGRLRPYRHDPVGRVTRAWAGLLYGLVYDPDARPWSVRRRREF
jgi:phosphatidylserine/phosphatidylglycerophosphate/cardiolipin synthase-like enzyme